MKSRMSIFLVVLSLAAILPLQVPSNVSAQGVELGDSVVVTAEIVAIDRADRALALLGPDGNVVAVEVSHAARNFDQIEVGDQVKVAYYESVAMYLGKRGQKPEGTVDLVAARSVKGDMPAGIVVEAVDISAEVQAIDKQKRTVTLELPDGRKVTSRVDKSVKAFDTLKVGESIHARYTEAIAISVEKP